MSTEMSSEMLSLGIRIASEVHYGHFDRGGNPYILHPLHVMYSLNTTDFELMTIAVMHDVLEDDKEKRYTIESLRELGMSERVLTGLQLLTHDPEVPYEDYIAAMLLNVDAMRVKRADIEHNSSITRLKGVRQKDTERFQKYCRAFMIIDSALKYRGI